MPFDDRNPSTIVAEQVEDYKRRLDVKLAAIEESQQKVLRMLEGMDQDLASIRAMLAEIRQHLSRPERDYRSAAADSTP